MDDVGWMMENVGSIKAFGKNKSVNDQ